MRQRIRIEHVVTVALFLFACALGVSSQRRGAPENVVPRAQFTDATPLGGKGLSLLLQRLGYRTQCAVAPLEAMPPDAAVWLLLDPQTRFSTEETADLLKWVAGGGTLIWASPEGATPTWQGRPMGDFDPNIQALRERLGVSHYDPNSASPALPTGPLTALTPLRAGSANAYWEHVQRAAGSDGVVSTSRPALAVASGKVGGGLIRINYGKGRVFVAPDALLFTNYALSKSDNAWLVTNLIRRHAASGTVYFDERYLAVRAGPTATDYLFKPPLGYAVLQWLAMALLLWALYGRRLGAPVPLVDVQPVTRASQFAGAMGGLFQRAHRPRAAGTIIGEEFRRALTRRLGLSTHERHETIARRAAESANLPAPMIDRLLLSASAPPEDEAELLSDCQEMVHVLRRLNLP